MENFRQALKLLHPGERRQIFSLLGLSTIAAVAQTVAILSIMPFIILLSNPVALETNPTLIRLDGLIGADSPQQLLVMLGIIGISALAIGNLFIALENWLIRRYLSLLSHRIEKDLMRTVLNQPFEFFFEHHSGRLSNIILEQVERVVDGVVGAFFGIVSNAVLTVFIVLMLLFISFETTLITLLALFTLYLTVFLFLKRRIASHGEEFTQLAGDVHTAVKETLEGILEIKMNRAEGFFARRFERSNLPLSQLAIRSSVLDFLPNFILETLVFSGLVGVGLYFVAVSEHAGMSLSFIALYGLATYRLVPALNGVFEGLSEMQHDGDAVRIVHEHFSCPPPEGPPAKIPSDDRHIRLKNVSYRYPKSNNDQLSSIDLDIPAGSSICLFGPSGAGKSSLLNVIAGLVRPKNGDVSCGDISISEGSLARWRSLVGFCPQQIYLFDGTIASNIAFGAENDEVDMERVQAVGQLAMLDRFVGSLTTLGYRSMVGEGGKTLSGGQRQRVGIARALYEDADILILDEALVGLDGPNQTAILDNLFALSGKTLIFSSHDPDTAARCDVVAVLEAGRLTATGGYHTLKSTLEHLNA